jgi:hypothetical protein
MRIIKGDSKMKFDFIQAVQLMQQGKTVKWNDGNLIFKIINNIVYIKNINDNSWKEYQGTLNDIINFTFEEYIENPKIDYSKWIGRNNDDLCIKGNKLLKSNVYDGEIAVIYSNVERESFKDELHYETVSLSELKYGDVVDLRIEENNKYLGCFGIFIGCSKYNSYYFQCLSKDSIVEYIYFLTEKNRKVNRFLRE